MSRLTWIGATVSWEAALSELHRPARAEQVWVEQGLVQPDLPAGAHSFSGVPPLDRLAGARSVVVYATGNPLSESRQPFWQHLPAACSARVILDPYGALALAAECDRWLQPGRPWAVVEGQVVSASGPVLTGPLAGIDVLVTRPLERARDLVRSLGKLGARALTCPMWRTDATDSAETLAAWMHSGPWDSVLVTSAQAAQLSAAAILRVRPVQVAAVGPLTATALRRGGVSVQLVGRAGAVSLASELSRTLQPGAKVAVLRAEGAPPTVLAALSSMGFAVTEVTTHRLIPAPPDALVPLGALVRRVARPWALVFDGRAAQVLASALAPSERQHLRVAVIGPQTAQTARECGLRVAAEATRPSGKELVSCLLAAGGTA
ncbi:MAG: uroporphyrinogen-III synthase [Sulfobacillus sp.]